MDNENKITEEEIRDLVTQSKNSFLRSEKKEFSGRQNLYNLEREFAKTKKNHSPVIWVTILSFIIVFAVASILVTSYIERESQKVPVDIAAFEYTNLRDVLDKAKEYEEQLQMAMRILDDMQQRKEQEIAKIQDAADGEIKLLENTNLSEAQYNRRLNAIKTERDDAIAAVAEEWDPQIEAQKREIELIREKINSYDSRQIELAKQQEELLNNQQQLFEIKLQESIDFYEGRIEELHRQYQEQIQNLEKGGDRLEELLKNNRDAAIEELVSLYNPEFQEERVRNILERDLPEDVSVPVIPQGLPEYLAQEGVFSTAELEEQSNNLEEFHVLISKLQEVPYSNSIPPTIIHLQYLYNQQAVAFLKTMQNVMGAITRKNREIAGHIETISSKESALREKEKIIETRNEALEVRNEALAAREAELNSLAVLVDSLKDESASRNEQINALQSELGQAKQESEKAEALIADKDGQISRLEYALTALAKDNREAGYILDPRNPEKLYVFVDPSFDLNGGKKGYVFRQNNDHIATIEFFRQDGELCARLLEQIIPERPIAPFDKILIELK